MTDQPQNLPDVSQATATPRQESAVHYDSKVLSWSSVVFAILQSACTAVIAISGFHQDAIRIPMMVLALLGAVINLYVIWKIRRLRSKPAAQWRVQPVSREKLNSERFQIALSLLTLLLLAAEWIIHPFIHRVP